LLNSPDGIVVLGRPSWLTAKHALALVGVLAAVLLLAFGWIRALRRQVEQRTVELQREIADHQRTEMEVKQKAELLAAEIEERKRMEQQVERVHKELLLTSRQAGMAEVATSILHNVGNVLNSVNVSAGLIAENLRRSKAANLIKVADLLGQNASRPDFLQTDEKGKQVPAFLRGLGDRLNQEHQNNVEELLDLQKNIEHIKRIVAMQQDFARVGGVVEKVQLSEIVEDSLRINAGALARLGVELVRDFRTDPQLLIEKHKVLQVLVNLIQNANLACAEAQRQDARIEVSLLTTAPDRVTIRITDNGIGISPQNLKRIFTPGFTTRKNGHGFGLHACILAAKDLKGNLTVHSSGAGQGATFELELPLTANSSEQVPQRSNSNSPGV
jgi:C4-dicarboxylate-specific signal transduction histidine kinase